MPGNEIACHGIARLVVLAERFHVIGHSVRPLKRQAASSEDFMPRRRLPPSSV